jgi:hypothetical protein
LWDFQCEHVGHNITPLSHFVSEFLLLRAPQLLKVTKPLSWEEWRMRYPLVRQAQLQEAYETVQHSMELTREDAKVDCFLKTETTTNMTDPRNISPRSDRFLATLGPYIAAIEHQMVRRPEDATAGFLVKGLNLVDRAKLITETLTGYSHYIETDYSRFDRTISEPILELVQDVLLTASFPRSQHPLLHLALDLARKTNGRSRFGVSYSIDGTRCSGDAHTSIGNGLINGFNTYLALRHLPNTSWTSIHEGDDGVIGIRDGVESEAEFSLVHLETLGFSLKMATYKHIGDVSFCGRHLYAEGGSVKDHADIWRSISKFHTSTSGCRADALLLAKAMSYYHTDHDTPIIGPLCRNIINVLRPRIHYSPLKRSVLAMKKERYNTRDEHLEDAINGLSCNITAEARASVARRANIPVDLQIKLEEAYDEMTLAGEILEVPKLPSEWVLRVDGHVYGPVDTWVR